jgi:hypothetical protein
MRDIRQTRNSALKTLMKDRLSDYLIFGLQSVDGFLDTYSAEFIMRVAHIQRAHLWGGAVGEIGVHHGKLFILLHLLADRCEQSFAIDVFENQHLNVDGSGRGDRDKFLNNMRQWCGPDARVSIICKSSLDVTPDNILSIGGPVRLLSIDGGHTEQCVLNDMFLAERVLCPGGVVILDDCFNESWPGVVTGLAKYMMGQPALVPIAISPNKTYFSRPECRQLYREEIRKVQKTYEGTKAFFGYDVEIYGCYARESSVVGSLKEFLKRTRVGAHLLALKIAVQQRAKRKPPSVS